MKRILCVVFLIVCMFSVVCCSAQPQDEIVGQWEYEKGGRYLLIYPNGEIFEVSKNGTGEYIVSVVVHEDGSYTTYNRWYKNSSNEYVYVVSSPITDEWERKIVFEGDSLSYDGGVYMWHRLSRSKEISLDEIYYFTFDEEDKAYVSHPLSEIIE